MAPQSGTKACLCVRASTRNRRRLRQAQGLQGLASCAALVLRQMQTFKLRLRLLLLTGFLSSAARLQGV